MQDDPSATYGRRVVPWWAVAAVVIGVAAWFFLRSLVAPLTYFQDEWVFVGERREFGLDLLLAPHNEHPAVIPALVYWLVFQIRVFHRRRHDRAPGRKHAIGGSTYVL